MIRIFCEQCGGKRVDTLTFTRDIYGEMTTFVAGCHGQFKRIKLPDSLLYDDWVILEMKTFKTTITSSLNKGNLELVSTSKIPANDNDLPDNPSGQIIWDWEKMSYLVQCAL